MANKLDKLPDFLKDKYTRYKAIATVCRSDFSGFSKYRDLVTRDTVAMKKFFYKDKEEGVPSSIIREVSLLKELEHANIVRLLDVLSSSGHGIDLVYEYLEYDLPRYMQRNVVMNSRKIKMFLHQVLDGLAYCHSLKILHGDLKPSNLLIDPDQDIVKIAGFGVVDDIVKIIRWGFSRTIDVSLEEYTTGVASLRYMAPEILVGTGKYSFPADIWAVGCIFAEMVIRRELFRGHELKDQMITIVSIMGTPNEFILPGWNAFCDFLGHVPQFDMKDLSKNVPGLDESGVDLLKRMLCIDARQRITALEALEHEFLKDV